MELINPDSWCQDIDALYQDVYQLHRLPGWGRCEEATEKWPCKKVLDSIKEHLRLRQPPTQPERQQMQLPADTSRTDPHTAFATMNHRTYEEMMALARDTWQWALVAAAILEEQMERMSHSTGHQCSTSCWHFSSCQCSASHRRSRSLGWQEEGSQATPHYRETEATPQSPQTNKKGRVDIDFFKHQRASQVTSCQGGAA